MGRFPAAQRAIIVLDDRSVIDMIATSPAVQDRAQRGMTVNWLRVPGPVGYDWFVRAAGSSGVCRTPSGSQCASSLGPIGAHSPSTSLRSPRASGSSTSWATGALPGQLAEDGSPELTVKVMTTWSLSTSMVGSLTSPVTPLLQPTRWTSAVKVVLSAPRLWSGATFHTAAASPSAAPVQPPVTAAARSARARGPAARADREGPGRVRWRRVEPMLPAWQRQVRGRAERSTYARSSS